LPKVIEGNKFNDGVEVTDVTENRAALECASSKFKQSSQGAAIVWHQGDKMRLRMPE
jgi:hypothetical protein